MKIDSTHLHGTRLSKAPHKAMAGEAFSALMKTSSLPKMEASASVMRPLSMGAVPSAAAKISSPKKILKRGEKILTHLSSLQRTLLGEVLSKEDLEEMIDEVKSQVEQSDHEPLRNVMEEIELRLCVELAKLESRSLEKK